MFLDRPVGFYKLRRKFVVNISFLVNSDFNANVKLVIPRCRPTSSIWY
jgi:hypothetical protein